MAIRHRFHIFPSTCWLCQCRWWCLWRHSRIFIIFNCRILYQQLALNVSFVCIWRNRQRNFLPHIHWSSLPPFKSNFLPHMVFQNSCSISFSIAHGGTGKRIILLNSSYKFVVRNYSELTKCITWQHPLKKYFFELFVFLITDREIILKHSMRIFS